MRAVVRLSVLSLIASLFAGAAHAAPAPPPRLVVVLVVDQMRGEYLRAATPADIAPTLALLCGITLARIDGEVLIEALSPAAVPPLPPARPTGAPKR